MSEIQKVYYAILSCYQDRFKLEKIRSMPEYSNYSTRLRKRLEAMIEELRNQEVELKKAVKDPDFVKRLEQSAVREAMERSEKHSKTQQIKRGMRQRWHGMSSEQIAERDQKIVTEYYKPRKSHLTMTGFAKRYAAKHPGLTPRWICSILKKAVGSLPG